MERIIEIFSWPFLAIGRLVYSLFNFIGIEIGWRPTVEPIESHSFAIVVFLTKLIAKVGGENFTEDAFYGQNIAIWRYQITKLFISSAISIILYSIFALVMSLIFLLFPVRISFMFLSILCMVLHMTFLLATFISTEDGKQFAGRFLNQPFTKAAAYTLNEFAISLAISAAIMTINFLLLNSQ